MVGQWCQVCAIRTSACVAVATERQREVVVLHVARALSSHTPNSQLVVLLRVVGGVVYLNDRSALGLSTSVTVESSRHRILNRVDEVGLDHMVYPAASIRATLIDAHVGALVT